MADVDPGGEAVRQAIAEERLLSARRVSVFRFFGISVAYLINLLMPRIIPEAAAAQADLLLFAAYWLLAAVVFWAARQSDRVAGVVGLDIALLDMPMIFVLQWTIIAKNPESIAPALVGVTFYMLLIFAAAFSLETRTILLAATVGVVLQVLILHRAGAGRDFMVSAAGVLAGIAFGCVYNARRTLHLVSSVASEQLFLSPEVARLVREKGLASVARRSREDLSVVACDLRGFTAFSQAAAPEQVIDLLQTYYDAVGHVVTQFRGTIKDHAGDGILILVGAPIPHPDHADRAVAMALAIRDRVSAALSRWRGVGLGIGIASGTLTVGAIGGATRLEYVAVGPAANLATRLCDRAESGQILVDEATTTLAGQGFELLETAEIKGFVRPVSIFAAR